MVAMLTPVSIIRWTRNWRKQNENCQASGTRRQVPYPVSYTRRLMNPKECAKLKGANIEIALDVTQNTQIQ